MFGELGRAPRRRSHTVRTQSTMRSLFLYLPPLSSYLWKPPLSLSGLGCMRLELPLEFNNIPSFFLFPPFVITTVTLLFTQTMSHEVPTTDVECRAVVAMSDHKLARREQNLLLREVLSSVQTLLQQEHIPASLSSPHNALRARFIKE